MPLECLQGHLSFGLLFGIAALVSSLSSVTEMGSPSSRVSSPSLIAMDFSSSGTDCSSLASFLGFLADVVLGVLRIRPGVEMLLLDAAVLLRDGVTMDFFFFADELLLRGLVIVDNQIGVEAGVQGVQCACGSASSWDRLLLPGGYKNHCANVFGKLYLC